MKELRCWQRKCSSVDVFASQMFGKYYIYAYLHVCRTLLSSFFNIHLDLFTGKKRQLRRRRRALNTSLYKRKEDNSDRPEKPTSEPSCDNLKDEPEYYCLYYMDGKYCNDCVFDPDTGENF